MLWISRILADLVKEYVASVSQSAGEYRLVVPGLTSQIGEELHTLLLANGIHSFLVIGTDRIPDERKRWLLPVSLTTMRIGSFVAVATQAHSPIFRIQFGVQAGLFVVQPFQRSGRGSTMEPTRSNLLGHSYPGFSLRGHRTQACAPGSNP